MKFSLIFAAFATAVAAYGRVWTEEQEEALLGAFTKFYVALDDSFRAKIPVLMNNLEKARDPNEQKICIDQFINAARQSSETRLAYLGNEVIKAIDDNKAGDYPNFFKQYAKFVNKQEAVAKGLEKVEASGAKAKARAEKRKLKEIEKEEKHNSRKEKKREKKRKLGHRHSLRRSITKHRRGVEDNSDSSDSFTDTSSSSD